MATVKVRSWNKYQHYGDRRRPIWIKLYIQLLDDPDFQGLEPELLRILIMTWLAVAEHKGCYQGAIHRLAYRMRVSPEELHDGLSRLGDWFSYEPDGDVLAGGYQDASLEEDKKKKRTPPYPPAGGSGGGKARRAPEYGANFLEHWSAHPYGSKLEAWKEYRSILKELPPDSVEILKGQKAAEVEAERVGAPKMTLPHLCRWFKRRYWENGVPKVVATGKGEDPQPKVRYMTTCSVCGKFGESFVHGRCVAHADQ